LHLIDKIYITKSYKLTLPIFTTSLHTVAYWIRLLKVA